MEIVNVINIPRFEELRTYSWEQLLDLSSKKAKRRRIERQLCNAEQNYIERLDNYTLLLIFGKLSFEQKLAVERVCRRWQRLIRWYVSVYSKQLSFVNCYQGQKVNYWKCDLFCDLFSRREYLRVDSPTVDTFESLQSIIEKCPRIRSLDIECYPLNHNVFKKLSAVCKQLERLNLDTCDEFTVDLAQVVGQCFPRLKHLNLSCVKGVNEEIGARLIQGTRNTLESLNLRGTEITGECLRLLGSKLRLLNISYCWALEPASIAALEEADCLDLVELSMNTFEFEDSGRLLQTVCQRFQKLQVLDMSIGNCVNDDYYSRNFESHHFQFIGFLANLTTLHLRKMCTVDDAALIAIMRGCPRMTTAVLDLHDENQVTPHSVRHIPFYWRELWHLEISGCRHLDDDAIVEATAGLRRLEQLVLRNVDISDEIVKQLMESVKSLRNLCLNRNESITKEALLKFVDVAATRPRETFTFDAVGCALVPHVVVYKLGKMKKCLHNIAQIRVSHSAKTKDRLLRYDGGSKQFIYEKLPASY